MCRQVREKRQLVRLVRLAGGTIVVDPTGGAPGRGAYVCADARCGARLVKGGRVLNHAFRRPCQAEAGLVMAVLAASRSTAEVIDSLERSS